MRSFRGYRLLPRRTYADVALDQMRRLADLLIAGVLILITSPLMLVVALAIKWEGPGPILERETCIARGGRRFEMLKFRTMLPDPEHTMPAWARKPTQVRSEEHTSELQSPYVISYAVFCLKTK